MTLRRALGALAIVVLVVVGSAGPASAHGGAVVATDYRARITDRAGLDVRVVEAGGRVELTNRSAGELTVLGYEGEPYLRVGRRGVFENRRSPATYLNATRTGGQQPPADATADAPPRWVRIGDGPTARWHDHRLHWMSTTPPAVRQHPDRRQRVAQWEIPVRVGDRTATVAGEITYVPGPPVWPWLLGAAVAALAVVLAARRLGVRTVLLVAVLLLVAADVVRVAGLSLVVVGTAGDRFRQAANVGTVDLVGWGLGMAAAVRLGGRRPDGRMAAGVAAIVLAVVGGVLEWGDLGRSQLATANPAALARACVVAVAGLGLGIAAAVLIDARRPRQRRAKPKPGTH
ncbi:MAG: hypothetical protein JWO68_3129 [Actinomycetia bacterium]|nr:hypothetical protein [Actinomycetes bacterium]